MVITTGDLDTGREAHKPRHRLMPKETPTMLTFVLQDQAHVRMSWQGPKGPGSMTIQALELASVWEKLREQH